MGDFATPATGKTSQHDGPSSGAAVPSRPDDRQPGAGARHRVGLVTAPPAAARATPAGGRRRSGAWRRSLGVRLVALFVLLALAMTAVFSAGMQRALAGSWSELIRPLLSDYVDRLAAEIGSPPDPARARALAERLPLTIRIDAPGRGPAADRRSSERHEHRFDGGDRLLTRETADGHRITFGVDAAGWERRPRLIGWSTLAALLLLTGLAYAATRRLFRPLDDIRAGAQRFGRGDFSTPIPRRRDDELGDLAAQVNTMAGGLQRMLEGQRALLLAVSHELRSPLTRARLNAELVAEGPARDALLRDLAAMRDLIADLLESERLAGGSAALQREPVDLGTLARTLHDGSFADLPLVLNIAPGLPSPMLDRVRITMLLRNLLDNARRHAAGASRPAELSLRQEGAELVLRLRDFGPGVAPEQLARLAEPFYRPDAARGRATGGVGLGLYLCRRVAEAHGGRLTLHAAEPGLDVELRLPMD
jgi:signal transduction histidine kinase